MSWSFTGVTDPVEVEMTQTLGFSPDVALLRFNHSSHGQVVS